MTAYEQAKAKKAELEAAHESATRACAIIPGVGTGPMGLTPDSVRATPEWQAAKRAAENAFANLRAFNGWFVKEFKTEYRAERSARRA